MTQLTAPRRTVGNVTLVPLAPGPMLSANSLFVEKAGLLIDTGAQVDTLRALQPKVRTVVYTHYHADHRWHGLHFSFAETWVHPLDRAPLESVEAMLAVIAPGAGQHDMYWSWLKDSVPPLRADRLFESEAPMDFGGVAMAPLHMPGHTPGLLCPYFPQERLLFLTDYDLTKFGPWYGNTGSDLDALEASLRRIADFEADWFMTSHLPGALDRAEMLALLKPFHAQITQRDERLVDLVSNGPKTLEELSSIGICYKPSNLAIPQIVLFERMQVEKHLLRLAARGEVSMHDGLFERA